ncbi:MAG: hypothetical protein WA210_06115 [Burkholderiaceae bacterium]
MFMLGCQVIPNLFAVVGLALVVEVSLAGQAALFSNPDGKLDSTEAHSGTASSARSRSAEAMFMLDYQVIPVPGGKSIDLTGFHVFNELNDWMYLGVGGHAPILAGEYGGFMAFDVTAHVQRKIYGNLFADAGLSLGGGGGGKSVQQSRILSGTGRYVKSYVGFGHDFVDFSLGANLAHMKFTNSAINHSQLNLFVQVPFSYVIGPYARSGDRLFSADHAGALEISEDPAENILTLGLDNLVQINPEGQHKNNINLVDMQFSHFMTKHSYWYFNAAAGYRGLPLYNQAIGGLGYRAGITPNIKLYGQLGIGSGGYAPETINTGPGLLIYPRISAEYSINKNFGVLFSAGYMFAPKGSSKNYTLGAALNYHIHSGDVGSGASGAANHASYRGYRFNLFQQTEFNVKFRGADQDKIKLLTIQFDNVVNDHIYIPVQVGAAYNTHLTYPGYGEITAGVGVQNKYDKNERFQFFGQLLVGANVHGSILKTGVGTKYGVSDRLAIYGVAGQTFAGPGSNREKFRSEYVGLGVTYRFSVPSW